MTRWIPLFRDQLDAAVAAVERGDVVCVVGPMGSGKSVLLEQVADRLGDRPSRFVRGVSALRGVPGGAVGEGWTSGVVHLVDDADEIDEVSAAKLRDLAEGAGDPVLLTLSARRRLPEAFAAMLDGRHVVELPIPPLDREAARSLMGSILEARVEAASAARALTWGAGTPLGVVRYAELARAEGAVVASGGYVAVDRRFTPGPSAASGDASARHRYRLPADDRVAVALLEYVAVARTLPYSVLVDLATAAPLDAEEHHWRGAVRGLLDRGVLTEVHDDVPGGGVRFAHPAAAWAVRDDLGGMGRYSVVGALRAAAGPPRRWPVPAWVVLVAEAARAGLDVPPDELADAVRAYAHMQVGEEPVWVDAGSALVSALPADFAATAPAELVTDLADVAVALHRAVDLQLLLDLLAPAVEAGHVAATFASAYLLQDGLGDTVGASFTLGDAAVAAREAGRTEDADALAAGRLALVRRAGGTYPADEEVALPAGAPRFLAAEVAATLALGALWEGRIVDTVTLLEPFGDPSPGGCEAVAIQGEVLAVAALATMAWGVRGDDGAQSPWSWLPYQHVNVHAGAGILLLERGAAAAARESLEQALSATVPSADAAIVAHLHRWAAAAAGRAGSHDDAVRHLEQARAAGESGRALDGVLGVESARLGLAAAASAPSADFGRAVAAARAALEDAERRGRHLVALNLLTELWRGGETVDTERWAGHAGKVHGPRAEALGRLAAAIRDGSGEAAAETVDALEATGQTATAAEAASTAAALLAAAGDRSGASHAVERSMELVGELGPTVLPRTGVRTPDDPRLTDREREIATMVARGMSNAAIASELVLSTRTIDSHVYRMLGKLGITDRRQLRVSDPAGVESTGSLAEPFHDL